MASYKNGTETTHDVGGRLEKVKASSTRVTYWRHYVATPGGTTLLISRNSDSTGTRRYLLTDHLGSAGTRLDGNGPMQSTRAGRFRCQ